jgi:hypothetical protein
MSQENIIQQIFDHASDMQPTGEARLGELETSVLTRMCQDLSGGDAREMAFQLFLRQFKDENGIFKENREVNPFVNGIDFEVMLTMQYDEECWLVRVSATDGPTQCGKWTVFEIAEEELESKLRHVFQLMEDNLMCAGCKQELALGTDFGLCPFCTTTWNTIPCTKCGGHFGCINDGTHARCK